MSISAVTPDVAPHASVDDLAFSLFRPHLFFYRPWTGEGEMFGANGRRVAAFTVSGAGRASSRLGRIVQEYLFDTGYRHRTEWKVLSTNGQDYRAIDADTGAVAHGRQVGDAFHWVLKVKGKTIFGQRTLRVATVYRMVARGVVEAVTTTTLFGVLKLGVMRTTYRRLDA